MLSQILCYGIQLKLLRDRNRIGTKTKQQPKKEKDFDIMILNRKCIDVNEKILKEKKKKSEKKKAATNGVNGELLI